MRIIVAADDNRGIGKDGGIPWHKAEDMRRFKNLTSGGTCVMGRKTWLSIPERFRPLPDRRNVVLSRSLDKGGIPGAYVVSNLNDALLSDPSGGTVWCIGGGLVYAEALRLGLVDEIHLTRIVGTFGCDTFWPGVPAGWTCELTEIVRNADGSLSHAYEAWCRPMAAPQ